MIDRSGHRRRVETLLSRNRVVSILGARQVGKTTLARQVASRSKSPVTWFDLENPDDLSRLSEPMLALADRLWIRGSFPPSYLAHSERASLDWRRDFIRTFLERDVPGLGVSIPSATLRRCWTMLAHSHGQVWNASASARSFGVANRLGARPEECHFSPTLAAIPISAVTSEYSGWPRGEAQKAV